MTPFPRAALGLGALALSFLTPLVQADAQPARRVPTVGFVGLPTDPSESRWQDGFARGLPTGWTCTGARPDSWTGSSRAPAPGELPFEQATKLDLVLNLKTARALGVMVPQSFVQRADRIIE